MPIRLIRNAVTVVACQSGLYVILCVVERLANRTKHIVVKVGRGRGAPDHTGREWGAGAAERGGGGGGNGGGGEEGGGEEGGEVGGGGEEQP